MYIRTTARARPLQPPPLIPLHTTQAGLPLSMQRGRVQISTSREGRSEWGRLYDDVVKDPWQRLGGSCHQSHNPPDTNSSPHSHIKPAFRPKENTTVLLWALWSPLNPPPLPNWHQMPFCPQPFLSQLRMTKTDCNQHAQTHSSVLFFSLQKPVLTLGISFFNPCTPELSSYQFWMSMSAEWQTEVENGSVSLSGDTLVIKYLTSNNTTKSLPAIWHIIEKYSGQRNRRLIDCWMTADTCACNLSQGFTQQINVII